VLICDTVLQCAGTLKMSFSLQGPVTADLTNSVVHSSKLLTNNVIPVHSLKS